MITDLLTIAQAGGGEGIGNMFIPMILIFVVMILFTTRGQKKERKKREEMMASIVAGDKVVTAGGLYAEVVTVKESSYIIRLGDKVNVEVSQPGIASVEKGEKEGA